MSARRAHVAQAAVVYGLAVAVALTLVGAVGCGGFKDVNLVSEQDEGHSYMERSVSLFHRETRGLDLGDADPQVLDECLLYNHRLLPVPGLQPAAECFRRAVIIEHARGLWRYGLAREEVAPLFERYPRDNFDRVLVDFTWRVIRREPLTLFRGILF